MIIVIGAIDKQREGGGYFKTLDGDRVVFAAHPDLAPPEPGCVFFRPDDAADGRESWRQRVARYNARPGNALGFYKAHRLYLSESYTQALNRFGADDVFTLSAGWGIVKAEYFTPDYRIAFGESAPDWMRRDSLDGWDDFRQLPRNSEKTVVFFGTGAQLPLFLSLTRDWRGGRIAFYRGEPPQEVPNCAFQPYKGVASETEWHLAALGDFAAGRLSLIPSPLGARREGSPKPAPKIAAIRKAFSGLLAGAAAKGEKTLDLRAGDLLALAGGEAAPRPMASCCKVMKEAMLAGDSVIESPPGGIGAALVVRYVFPRPA